jgi:hypothetical protein
MYVAVRVCYCYCSVGRMLLVVVLARRVVLPCCLLFSFVFVSYRSSCVISICYGFCFMWW